MKIETSKATGLQLDWGVAEAMSAENIFFSGATQTVDVKFGIMDWPHAFTHTDPAVCMGLIKEYCINIQHDMPVRGDIIASIHVASERIGWGQCGDTVEQAVARVVIAMKLGDEFECPDELGVML